MGKQGEAESKRERQIEKARFGNLCSHKIWWGNKGNNYQEGGAKNYKRKNNTVGL